MKEKTERRSVIKYGHSLTCSLPAAWCKFNNVVKGSELIVCATEESISLYPTITEKQEVVLEESIQTQEPTIQEVSIPEPTTLNIGALIRKHLAQS